MFLNCVTLLCSSLLTACTKGNRVDRALHWYEHMTQAHIEADFITYRFAPVASPPISTALTACPHNTQWLGKREAQNADSWDLCSSMCISLPCK